MKTQLTLLTLIASTQGMTASEQFPPLNIYSCSENGDAVLTFVRGDVLPLIVNLAAGNNTTQFINESLSFFESLEDVVVHNQDPDYCLFDDWGDGDIYVSSNDTNDAGGMALYIDANQQWFEDEAPLLELVHSTKHVNHMYFMNQDDGLEVYVAGDPVERGTADWITRIFKHVTFGRLDSDKVDRPISVGLLATDPDSDERN